MTNEEFKNKVKTIHGDDYDLSKLELTRSQRLAMLTRNVDYATVKEWGMGKALLKTATSARVLRMALRALTSVGLVVWLASIMAWTDKVKKNVDGFNNLVENGDSSIKEARTAWENSTKAISDQNEKIRKAKSENKPLTQLYHIDS